MAQLVSIVFFFGLIAALAVILELTLKEHKAAILAALRGPRPAAVRRARAAAPRRQGARAAA